MLAATYVVPQVLYRKTEGRWLLPLVPFLRALALPARPLAAMLRFFQSVVDLGDPEPADEEAVKPEEHIDALIAAGTEEGIIEEEDRKLIQAAVAFGDKTVREVMTPRPSIVAIEAGRSLDDLRNWSSTNSTRAFRSTRTPSTTSPASSMFATCSSSTRKSGSGAPCAS